MRRLTTGLLITLLACGIAPAHGQSQPADNSSSRTHSHSSTPNPRDDSMGIFKPSPSGYVRHWLVAGPQEKPYSGPSKPEHILRSEALDYSTATPPGPAALGETGPFGMPWLFHDPGRNEFVEFSTFYGVPTVLDYYACTEVTVPKAGERKARLWVAGAADLWVNGVHITRLNITRYRNPDFERIALPFKQGLNRLCIRLQCLGIRDTRILFGLSLEDPAGVTVSMPGAGEIARAERWIDTVRAPKRGGLESAEPAPFNARIVEGNREVGSWPAGSSAFTFTGDSRPFAFSVETTLKTEGKTGGVVSGQTTLKRELEIPANRPPLPASPAADRRIARLEYTAKAGIGGEAPAPWNARALPLLARRLLGRTTAQDAPDLAGIITMINRRNDCSDFVLAGLLRMEMLHLWTPEESAQVRQVALGFRYWNDEPGNDGMCFDSENHTLLFHGCELLAGRLYPDDVFQNSGRTGKQQAEIALRGIKKWLDKVEARGFEEFNSSSYAPITVSAMLNVVDFSGDKELSSRMSAQVDRVLRDIAQHEFGGGVITPQGRVYRDVLVPELGGTEMLLAAATDATTVDLSGPRPAEGPTGDWSVFLLSSPNYRPPADLAAKVTDPVSKTYRQADFQIVLEKTPAYVLTSLAVPAVPREGEHPETDLRPGGAGYQQHLWEATLGRDCHVFVNHPGCFFDGPKTSRPGYWYGDGALPRLRQKGNWLQAIYVIPDGTRTKPEITQQTWLWPAASSQRPFNLYPIPFVHAYWPSDAFDVEKHADHWMFGQKGRGLIGLWCSEPLAPHDDILTKRELRANSYASAWLVICGDTKKEGSLEKFMAACRKREPVFDRKAFTLSMKGEEPTKWWERSEPMPE